jgi:hypothetical protein
MYSPIHYQLIAINILHTLTTILSKKKKFSVEGHQKKKEEKKEKERQTPKY